MNHTSNPAGELRSTVAGAKPEGPSALAPIGMKRRFRLPAEDEGNVTLLRYWAAIHRHAWRIGAFIVATIVFTGFILMRLPRQFQGTAVVRLDPTMPAAVISGQTGSAADLDIGRLLATDEHEITSASVVIPTILKLGLAPGASGSASDPPPSITAAEVAQIMQGIRVTHPTYTYLLKITYRSSKPTQAAAVANALAEQFIEHEYQTRNNALLSLSQYMRTQVKELGARMEKSELALNQFERANNIVNPDNISSLLTQQLSALQQELEKEQADQRRLDANLALGRQGSLDALLVSGRGSSLDPLLEARRQAQLRFDALASKYGPGNYLYQEAQRDLEKISKALKTEEQHVAAQIEAQAHAKKVQVDLTAARLTDAESQLHQFNNRMVQYDLLKHQADSDKSIYDDLLKRVNDADVSAGYHSTALRIVDAARPNPHPVYPRVWLTLILAGLIASVVGACVAVAASGLDRTFRDPETARLTLGTEVLGSLPEVRNHAELAWRAGAADAQKGMPHSPFAESVLGIESTLLLSNSKNGLRTLAVVSALPGEGKTTVAVNLASAMSALGKRTILLDGDLRRPGVHRVLEISNRRGLSSVLDGEIRLEEAFYRGVSDTLTILPAGPTIARPGEAVASRIGALLEEAKSHSDLVVIDTPPLLGFADALNLCAAVDSVIMVVRAGKTDREFVLDALAQLRQVRASVAGIVLNGVTPEMSYHYYYYGNGYHHYYSSNGDNHDAQSL